MNLCSDNQLTERAQPWLGTLVTIRVEGLPQTEAHRAIDEAFKEIAAVHRLMSFHDPESDVSRLNLEATRHPVAVHPLTHCVLEEAQRFSLASNGCFDVSVGAELVEWGMLPKPHEAQNPQRGSWQDIELLPGNRVIFHRPLWIDLGGIAKGFAVDRAAERLGTFGATSTVINAGGDVRVQGSDVERIRLGAASHDDASPVLELADGSVAGSSGALRQSRHVGRLCGPHVDGLSRAPAPVDRFVWVVAARCITADALTKVVMAKGAASRDLLRQFDASAYISDPGNVWLQVGAMETEMK